MEQASLMAVQDGFFTGWIRETENTMTVQSSLSVSKKEKKKEKTEGKGANGVGKRTYSGLLLGAHTMATLSGSMTWYPTEVCRSLLLKKQVWEGCVCIQPHTIKPSLST